MDRLRGQHGRRTSTESIGSVFSQALSIISRTSTTAEEEVAQSQSSTAPAIEGSKKHRKQRQRRRKQSANAFVPESSLPVAGHDVAALDGSDASEALRREREARSIAIEKAYVHDVYEQISAHICDSRYRAWPRVRQFLQDLEPGSLVCDVGCGNGKYLGLNPNIYFIGSDRCKALAQMAREKDHEILHCDNLCLPFRDESLDAVLSVAVIHHIATMERRVRALREIARVLRTGGRVMISVWAMEQRHRKFDSQDVLIPWHRPSNAGSGGTASSATGNAPNAVPREQGDSKSSSGSSTQLKLSRGGDATTGTSEEDVTHYHAYTQTATSDSGSCCTRIQDHPGTGTAPLRPAGFRRKKLKGRSIDPGRAEILGPAGYNQSSSDLSSPNESCYSFVRKAIQKISGNRRPLGTGELPLPSDGRTLAFPWFHLAGFDSLSSPSSMALYAVQQQHQRVLEGIERKDSNESNDSSIGDLPIELRHLEEAGGAPDLGGKKGEENSASSGTSSGGSPPINGSSSIRANLMSALLGFGPPPAFYATGQDESCPDKKPRDEARDSGPLKATAASCKSKSMDDISATQAAGTESKGEHASTAPQKLHSKKPSLGHLGRANTYESRSTLPPSYHTRPDSSSALKNTPETGILRSLSASLRSFDISSLRTNTTTGSNTSLSSCKSFLSSSSQSTQSAEARARVHSTEKRSLGVTRSWDSEPLLDSDSTLSGHWTRSSGQAAPGCDPRSASVSPPAAAAAGGGPAAKNGQQATNCSTVTTVAFNPRKMTLHHIPLLAAGEKEKSRTMLGVESKVMKAIKELPESDLSELSCSTPLNSPPVVAGARRAAVAAAAASEQQTEVAKIADQNPQVVEEEETERRKGKKEKEEEGQQQQQQPFALETKNSHASSQLTSAAAAAAAAGGDKRCSEAGSCSTSESRPPPPPPPPTPPRPHTKTFTTHHHHHHPERGRPQLVKQKTSFHYEAEEEEAAAAEATGAESSSGRHADDERGPRRESSKKSPLQQRGEEEEEEDLGTSNERTLRLHEHPHDDAAGAANTRLSAGNATALIMEQPAATKKAPLPAKPALLKRRSTLSSMKQSSLNDELLSRERHEANEQVRQRVRKQQSLDERPITATTATREERSFRDSLLAMTKSKQFESLKAGWSILRSAKKSFEDLNEEDEDEKDEEKNTHQSQHKDESKVSSSSASSSTNVEHSSSASDSVKSKPAMDKAGPNTATNVTVTSLSSGFVRIWQSWSSRSGEDNQSSTAGGNGASFTHKRGVSIQPLEVRTAAGSLEGVAAAARRSLFSRRRVSSPISPKQLEALTKENVERSNLSPTTLRRCCMECPGGEIVYVERERKLSRGEASDSSSKDSSIQSDTSIDSEDSCVSVIFVPHPESKLGTAILSNNSSSSGSGNGASFDNLSSSEISALAKKQRSTSNSSESSDSLGGSVGPGSKCGSPLMSPHQAGATVSHWAIGSPVKTVKGAANAPVLTKMELLRTATGSTSADTIPSSPAITEGTALFFLERPLGLEKIDERHTESEAEEEESSTPSPNPPHLIPSPRVACSGSVSSTEEDPKDPRQSEAPKSFEMEDIPKEASKHPNNPPKPKVDYRDQRNKFDYPIVRHHPLFAKQPRYGEWSNFSSLLLGQNIRVIRTSVGGIGDMSGDPACEDYCRQSNGDNDPLVAKMRSFEIFNPEIDDLDSDDDLDSQTPTEDDSEESLGIEIKISKEVPTVVEEDDSSNDSHASMESVVEVATTAVPSTVPTIAPPPKVIVTEVEAGDSGSNDLGDKERDGAPTTVPSSTTASASGSPSTPSGSATTTASSTSPSEAKTESLRNGDLLARRAEERRRILESLFQENESVLSKIGKKKSENLPANKDGSSAQSVGHCVYGSPEPESGPNPNLTVPDKAASRRKRLDKSRSVSPSACARQKQMVVRQSSVPSKFDEIFVKPTTEMEIKTKQNLLQAAPTEKKSASYLEVSPTASEVSSLESFTSDTTAGSKTTKSKSTSPSSSSNRSIEAANSSTGQGATSTASPSSHIVTGTIQKRFKPVLARQLSHNSELNAPTDDQFHPFTTGPKPPHSSRGFVSVPGSGNTSANVSRSGSLKKRAQGGTAHQSTSLSDPRRPSIEELAQTVSLLPRSHFKDSLEEEKEENEDVAFALSKLSELDPRFDRACSTMVAGPTSAAVPSSTSLAGTESCSQSDSEGVQGAGSVGSGGGGFPYRRLDRRKGREDSMESSSTSAKSSVQYSDTSSLLSHRFSTISISSNVSSEVSFGNTSVLSGGSSCYLASMSSTDIDDKPMLTSSFSVSEDQGDELDAVHAPPQRPAMPGANPASLALKSLFRGKTGRLPSKKNDDEVACDKSSTCERKPRSRIGTETSVETSIENPTCIDRSSFEEELFHGLEDEEAEIEPTDGGDLINKSRQRESLSTASSMDSAEDGGSQTHHRYYHVFREGELDFLINQYVESLHIINSYYDHANWCVVAEKVNVWTI